MRSVLPSLRRRLRLLVPRCVLIVAAMLLLRTWCLEGLVVSQQVFSGSMAETLLGVHREVVCADCRYPFVCGSDLPPVAARAVCPNCGYAKNGLEGRDDLAGDRLLVSKSIFRFRSPRRWEVVAFHHPQQAAKTLIKRVVGLPGESIQIRDGDVYVCLDGDGDGEIQRKTLPQQRALAILVHDANFQPTIAPAPPRRWQGEGEDSQWNSFGGRFTRRATAGERPADDWLVYRHWYRTTGPGGRTEIREDPITDVCGYNQTRPRREEETHAVTDLMLSLRLVKTFGEGRLVVRATDGWEKFEVRIDPAEGRWNVFQNGRPVPNAVGEFPSPVDGVTLEVWLFDCQFVLTLNGEAAFGPWPYDDRSGRPQPIRHPLAIGSQGGLGVDLRDLRVYRDVYYTHPIGRNARWGLDEPYELADDEYFVLGDNSPISEDSRVWPEGPAVPSKLLLGKPLVVHFPVRRIRWGGSVFQVPDPARIRYIQ